MKDSDGRRDLAKQLDLAIKKIKKLQTEKQNLLEELYIDHLTRIGNRRAFDEKLPGLVKLAHSSNEPLAVLIADVDGLKRVNDALGHTKGDELLITIAKELDARARHTDLVGRLGGDEYYAVLPGFSPLTNQTEARLMEATAHRYGQAFGAAVAKLGLPAQLSVGVSFGIAILMPNETAEDLYRRADEIARSHKKHLYANLSKAGASFKDERLDT